MARNSFLWLVLVRAKLPMEPGWPLRWDSSRQSVKVWIGGLAAATICAKAIYGFGAFSIPTLYLHFWLFFKLVSKISGDREKEPYISMEGRVVVVELCLMTLYPCS